MTNCNFEKKYLSDIVKYVNQINDSREKNNLRTVRNNGILAKRNI